MSFYKDSFNKLKYTLQSKFSSGLTKKSAQDNLKTTKEYEGMTATEKANKLKEDAKRREEQLERDRIRENEEKSKQLSEYNYASVEEQAEMSEEQLDRYLSSTTGVVESRLSYGTSTLVINDLVKGKFGIKTVSFDDTMDAYKVSVPRVKGSEQDTTVYILGDLTIMDEINNVIYDARDSTMNSVDKSMTRLLNLYGTRDAVLLYNIILEMRKGLAIERNEAEFDERKALEREQQGENSDEESSYEEATFLDTIVNKIKPTKK